MSCGSTVKLRSAAGWRQCRSHLSHPWGGFCFSWWWFGSGESDIKGNAPPSASEPAATALTHPYQASEQPHLLPGVLQMLGQRSLFPGPLVIHPLVPPCDLPAPVRSGEGAPAGPAGCSTRPKAT